MSEVSRCQKYYFQILLITFILFFSLIENISLIGNNIIINDINDQTDKEENFTLSDLSPQQETSHVKQLENILIDANKDQSKDDKTLNSNDLQNLNTSNVKINNAQWIETNSIQNPKPPIIPTTVGITNSGDMEMPEGLVGKDITWDVSGSSAQNNRNTRIIRNGVDELYTCSAGGCWGTVSLNTRIGTSELSSRPEGIWTYTLEAWGDDEILDPRANSTVIVSVVRDVESPIFVTISSNQTFEKGIVGNIIKWNVTDRFPNNYVIYGNGTQIDSGSSWNNSSFILFSGVNDLEIGITNITIQVFDELQMNSTHTVFISMFDTIKPIFNSFPGFTSVNEGSLGISITWRAMDLNPTTYNITIDGNFLTGNTIWDNSTLFGTSLDGLEEGIYEIKLSVYDLGGNVNSNSVMITVIGSPPTINNPLDHSFNEGSTGNIISWIANDNHPLYFEINSNTSLPTYDLSGPWITGVAIEINLDSLDNGVYSFTITVFDVVGNSVSDEVIIIVLDITKPQLILITFENKLVEGSSNKFIEWQLYDSNPGIYSIYVNDELVVSSIPWNNNTIVRYDLDELKAGEYNITIVIIDSFQNQNSNSVFLTIKKPLISRPFYRNPGVMIFFIFLIFLTILALKFGLAEYQKRRDVKLQQIKSLEEINGLLGIQLFMIVLPGGVPIYQESYRTSGLDPALLGGFGSAISMFMNQVVESSHHIAEEQQDDGKLSKTFEIIEKQGLSIISHHTPESTIQIISEKKLPEMIYNQLYNLHLIVDKTFSKYFNKTSSTLYEAVLHPIFEEVGLKLKLLNNLEIDIQELGKITEHPTLTEYLKIGFDLLKEFYEIYKEEGDTFQIGKLMAYYRQKGYEDNKAADFVLFAYNTKIIK